MQAAYLLAKQNQVQVATNVCARMTDIETVGSALRFHKDTLIETKVYKSCAEKDKMVSQIPPNKPLAYHRDTES